MSVGITIIVVVLIVQYMVIMPPQIEEAPQAIDIPEQELPIVVTTPATGDVDDAINAILDSVTDEQALFADEERDAALLGADSQAISDFGQSFNENEL